MSKEIYDSVVSKMAMSVPIFAKALVNRELREMGLNPYSVSPAQMYKIIRERLGPKLEYFMKTPEDIESSGTGVVVQNPAGEILSINQAAYRLLGVGGIVRNRKASALKKMNGLGFSGALSDGKDKQVRVKEVSIRFPQKVDLCVLSGPMFDRRGKVSGRITFLRDETLRAGLEKEADSLLSRLENINRTLEKRVAARTRELSKLNRELVLKSEEHEKVNERLRRANKRLNVKTRMLRKANLELESLDKMKSNLISNVSHELKTPLIALKGYVDLLLERQLGPITVKQRKGLKVMERAVERLEMLINNLLQLTRMEETRGELSRKRFNIIDAAEEAISFLSAKALERGMEIKRKFSSEPLLILADREKINQVFLNLISNAIKFNRDGEPVTVKLSKASGRRIKIQVSDKGRGIPRSERDRIFERFFQVDSTPGRKYGGIGLGLSITKEFVELHGGRIGFTSSPEKGTTFSVVLSSAGSEGAGKSRKSRQSGN